MRRQRGAPCAPGPPPAIGGPARLSRTDIDRGWVLLLPAQSWRTTCTRWMRRWNNCSSGCSNRDERWLPPRASSTRQELDDSVGSRPTRVRAERSAAVLMLQTRLYTGWRAWPGRRARGGRGGATALRGGDAGTAAVQAVQPMAAGGRHVREVRPSTPLATRQATHPRPVLRIWRRSSAASRRSRAAGPRWLEEYPSKLGTTWYAGASPVATWAAVVPASRA